MSVLLSLMMLLSLLPTAVLADDSATKTYTKVTQAPEDWSGTYLIVSEDSKVALDSSLSKVDAINDYKAVTIENGTIETAENIAVTIAKMADGSYSIQAVNGKYLYQSTDANGLKEGATAMPNTISLNEDGTVDIVSGGAYLRFNYSSNQMRFRYYKSATYASQQPITLYKLGGGLEQVATPTGTASGDVKVGDTVAFACETADASLQYKVDDGAYQAYTGPVTITTSCTITVKAVKDGMADSQEAVFTYKAYNLVDKYVKTAALTGGDKAVIFNAGNGFAISSTMKGSYYLTPVAATVEKDVLTADTMDALVWDVTANDDGTYTFTQGGKTWVKTAASTISTWPPTAPPAGMWRPAMPRTPPTTSPAAASPGSTARSTWNTSPSTPSSLPTAPAPTG